MPKSHGIEIQAFRTQLTPVWQAIISEPQRALGGEGLRERQSPGAGGMEPLSLYHTGVQGLGERELPTTHCIKR